MFRSCVWLSLLCGSAGAETQQHAICSAFSISADKYVDTGLSLRDVSTNRRRTSASQLQSAVISAAGNIASGNASTQALLDTTKMDEYASSLIVFVIPGTIILIFSFLGVVPIFIARCCMPHKCCPPKKAVRAPGGEETPPDKEMPVYTNCESASPVISYIIFALIVLILVVVGMFAAGTILQGMTDAMCSLEILVGDLDIFMTDLAGAIKDVADQGVGLLDKVATQVDITSDIQLKVDHTVGNMSVLITWLSNQTYDGATTIFDPAAIASAQQSILSAKGSAMQQLGDSRTMVLDKLVQPREFITNILEMVEMATNLTAEMLGQANYLLQEKPIKTVEIPFLLRESVYQGLLGLLAELRDSNLVVGAALFSLVVVTIPLTILGVCVMKCKGKCANCCGLFITRGSCALLFLAMTLVAVLGLVLLPISIVFSDVCILMDTLPQDVRVYASPFLAREMTATAAPSSTDSPGGSPGGLVDLSMETGLRVVDACWEDENLMDALNLTNTLSTFVDRVDFSALDDLSIDPRTMFRDFYGFKAEVAALTPEKFGLNLSTIVALERVCDTCTGFDDLPESAKQAYTTPAGGGGGNCDNKCNDTRLFPAVTGAPKGQMYAHCRTIQKESCTVEQRLRAGYDDIVKLTKEANTRLEAQTALVQGLSDHVTSLHRQLNNTRSEFKPFADSLPGINKYSSCHFVVKFFESTRSAVCGSPSTLSGMLWFATSLATVPLLSIGLVVATMCINCRIGGIGQVNHDHLQDIKDQTKRGIHHIKTRFTRNPRIATRTVKAAPSEQLFPSEQII